MDKTGTDTERFIEWGHDHGPAVRGYLWSMVRRRDLADDLTQEVFCRAWQARDRYREQGNARAYLLRIADRLVFDRSRKTGREVTMSEEGWRQIEPESLTATPAQAALQAEAARRLAQAMDELSSIQRRVLLLRYYGQMSFSEIAEMIGCPLNTTLSHGRRGLLALRKTLVEETP